MSKQIKQMQMDVLEGTFKDVRDAVFLTGTGIDVFTENTMRLTLRKKNVRMQMVKNSLLRRVFGKAGLNLPEDIWLGPTIVAWGGDSVKGLSKELEAQLKLDKVKTKLKVKSVLADGQVTTFEKALRMPTRLEAIGEIIAAAIGAGGAIAACLTGPGGQIASQIQTISEKSAEPAPAA